MITFTHGQRVIAVSVPDIHGKSGTVVRIRHADNGAWVKMDESLPAHLQAFPSSDSRANHILLYPEECSEAKGETQ